MLTRNDKPGYSTGLFKSNFEPGDWSLLAPLANRQLDKDDYHWMSIDLLAVFELYPDLAAIDFLLKVYDRGYCSSCRFKAINHLASLNAVPAWLAVEGVYDSNAEIRDFFENQIDKPA